VGWQAIALQTFAKKMVHACLKEHKFIMKKFGVIIVGL